MKKKRLENPALGEDFAFARTLGIVVAEETVCQILTRFVDGWNGALACDWFDPSERRR